MEGASVVGGGDADDEKATARAVDALTHALERIVERNDRISLEAAERWPSKGENEKEGEAQRRGLAAFRGARAPSMSVGKYLERIQRYTGCGSSCFVVGFVYIDRAAHRHPGSPVVSLNVHRLVLTSVLVASKVLDDAHHNNAFFAKVGGVSNAELNRLELELLLLLLNFEVMVTSRDYEIYCGHLEKEMKLASYQKPQKSISRAVEDDGDVVDGEETDLDMGSPQRISRPMSRQPSRRSVEW